MACYAGEGQGSLCKELSTFDSMMEFVQLSNLFRKERKNVKIVIFRHSEAIQYHCK